MVFVKNENHHCNGTKEAKPTEKGVKFDEILMDTYQAVWRTRLLSQPRACRKQVMS